MTCKERLQPPDGFVFSEIEALENRISDERFQALLEDESTTIHRLAQFLNYDGEFLFLTLSRVSAGQREALTFWGMGYDEMRQHWIHDRWHWYPANPFSPTLAQQLSVEEVQAKLDERRAEIAPWLALDAPAPPPRLFAVWDEEAIRF